MRILVITFLIISSFSALGQRKSKNSYSRGTLFAYAGYNRSFYSNSAIEFSGYGYNFKMDNVTAYDNSQKVGLFDFSNIDSPQFSGRLGYYIKDHWAISIGMDQMKYVMASPNDVIINGNIDEGLDQMTNLSGNYDNLSYTTVRDSFHYQNTKVSSYLRLGFSRDDRWYMTRSGEFAFTSIMGLGVGGLLTSNDFNFAGRQDNGTSSLSGYGISANFGARLEFFRHLFLQLNLNGGVQHQLNVKTRSNDPSARAKHLHGYAEIDLSLGFLFYVKPTNDCNSCPHW